MYQIHLLEAVYAERKGLPGNIRQRIVNLIESLSEEARPHNSIELRIEDIDLD